MAFVAFRLFLTLLCCHKFAIMESTKTKLLIVDDSALMQKLLKGAIEKIAHSGFNNDIKIMQAINCYEARHLYKCAHPEMVILDISLPDGSGLNLLDEFRQEANNTPPASIFVLTNHASPEFRKRCLAAGANEFFDKADIHSFLTYLTSKFNQPN